MKYEYYQSLQNLQHFYIIPMLDVFNIKWYKKQYEIDFERPMFASQIRISRI